MHEINFVHKALGCWSTELIESMLCEGIDKHADVFKEGRDIWIIQTYIALKRSGYSFIHLSGTYRENCINIAHRIDVTAEDCEEYFIVSVRADREPMFYAHYEILQNKSSLWAKNHLYIPHWPQPGLIERDRSRGQSIENISFFGKACHLKEDFLQQHFKDAFLELSCELKVHESDWSDYSKTDLVMAIRDGHRFYLDFKPASKLVNAWKAGCPIFVSREAGYAELRQSDLDFLEVESPAEVVSKIKHLKENPEIYNSMVINGQKRAVEFTSEAITNQWIIAIEQRLRPAFESWLVSHRSNRTKHLVSSIREVMWGWQATQYPADKKRLIISLIRVSLAYPAFAIKIIRKYVFG